MAASIKTRCAVAGDAQAVTNLLLRGRSELAHSLDIHEDIDKAQGVLAQFAASPAHFFYVLETGDEIVGALVGMVAPIWWSRDEVATDLFFYVAPEYRGHGIHLLKRFIAWAKGFDSVRRIFLSISIDNERAAQLYERVGFVRNGNSFVMEVSA